MQKKVRHIDYSMDDVERTQLYIRLIMKMRPVNSDIIIPIFPNETHIIILNTLSSLFFITNSPLLTLTQFIGYIIKLRR